MPCVLGTTAPEGTPPDLVRLVPDCQLEECDLAPLPEPGEVLYRVTAADVQCRAAANAAVPNMIELEEHWASVIIECDSKYVQRNMCLLRDLLDLRAADLRNKAAESALETFYRLGALEARRHYLDMAIEETSQSLARADSLRDANLPAPEDHDEISVQLAQLEDERLQLQYARLVLNGQLQKLIGCPVSEQSFLWPEVDWTPDLAAPDAGAELADGLPRRYDLRAIGLMWCNLERSTLRVARGVLNVADGAVGSVEPTSGWIHRLRCIMCSDIEVDIRCRQLQLFYDDTEQLATGEIKAAVSRVVLQQQRVAAARLAVDARRAHLYELTAKRDADDVPVFELTRARGRLFTAEAELVQQVADLKIAQATLKRCRGLLGEECGFAPCLCRENCCCGACTRCQAPTCRPGQLPCRCEKCCRH
ncbi:MAG TPA: hypothetical protein PJ982_06415 [Lacipirellulaceae bacterium]|nr:hypothetical protein [Lacipirellulaceae bacterium]